MGQRHDSTNQALWLSSTTITSTPAHHEHSSNGRMAKVRQQQAARPQCPRHVLERLCDWKTTCCELQSMQSHCGKWYANGWPTLLAHTPSFLKGESAQIWLFPLLSPILQVFLWDPMIRGQKNQGGRPHKGHARCVKSTCFVSWDKVTRKIEMESWVWWRGQGDAGRK